MNFDWNEFRLEEVGRIVTGKTPKGGIPEYEGQEVPFVTPADFVGNKWITSTSRTISEAGAQSVKGSTIEPRSVLVTCIGSDMGKAAIAKKRCVANQQINSILVDESKFCPEFIYYNLSLRKNEIRGIAGGSAQPILNKSAFSRLTLSAPVLNEQKRISGTLRPLDDQITLLRETNLTLEAIAQALFKSWFVDFDPVRAKQEGIKPEGMDEATAALFPDSFEQSELGEIPKGWKVQKFEDFVQRLSVGKKFDQKTALASGLIPILDQGKSGIIGYHNEVAGVNATMDKPVVVFANHTCYMRLICYDFSAIQNVLPFCGKKVDTVWSFFATKDRINFTEYKGHWPDFAIEKAVVPSFELTDAFRNAIDSHFRRSRVNDLQAETLTNIRHTLLPRLLSGQLRLPDAEEQIEAVKA